MAALLSTLVAFGIFSVVPLTSMHSVITIATDAPAKTKLGPQGSDIGKATSKTAKNLTLSGKLSRAMGIGGESSGWTIELDSKRSIAGKEVDSIEVEGSTKELDTFDGQQVTATGTIITKHGVERGSWPVLKITRIQKSKARKAKIALEGPHWNLTALSGANAAKGQNGTVPNLVFADKKVSGSGGCNRVGGSYATDNDAIHFSPMAMTRMACVSEALNQQEQAFTQALEYTTSYRIVGRTLELLHGEKVLARFEAQP